MEKFETRIGKDCKISKTAIISPFLESGIKGIDRIVPVGQTMDFSFIWDGYDLYERLTRTVRIL